MNITVRPITNDDIDFLHRLYASTREPELAQVDWTPEQKAAFVEMQFIAQHNYYLEYYSDATFLLILGDEQPIGRLYVARWPQEIRIVDIALMPEYRNLGIGTALIKLLFAEGEQEGKPVSIHVEQFNPAIRLYERLGFSKAGETGVYHLMKWYPPAG